MPQAAYAKAYPIVSRVLALAYMHEVRQNAIIGLQIRITFVPVGDAAFRVWSTVMV